MFADIHTHIFNNIDDGPETLEQSVELLKAAVQNGCKKIIATPHFYAERHSLTERLKIANARYTDLKNYILQNQVPISLLQGLEVRYFNGISKIDSLDELCINGSKVLLLELEPLPFTEQVIDEILDLNYFGYTIVLAHVERYAKISGFKAIKRLMANGVVVAQCNASSILSGPFQRAAIRLIKEGLISVIASDMHSLEHRPPLLKEAYEIIESKFGKELKNKFIDNAEKLFNGCL